MYKRTTIALLIFLLTAGAAAQKAPAKFTVAADKISITNTSRKEIIAYVFIPSLKGYGVIAEGSPSGYDRYFGQGLPPAATEDITDMIPQSMHFVVGAKLVFAQFADGSTWGDASLAVVEDMLSMRQVQQHLLNGAAAAVENHGESGFIEFLESQAKDGNHSARGKARHLLQVQKQAGTQAALDEVNKRLTAANSRPF